MTEADNEYLFIGRCSPIRISVSYRYAFAFDQHGHAATLAVMESHSIIVLEDVLYIRFPMPYEYRVGVAALIQVL